MINKESTGYKSLLISVRKDTNSGQGCFNENGCDHEFHRTVPQDNYELSKIGMRTACRRVSKCQHKYCDKFKWIIDRAEHYSEKTGISASNILDSWEERRGYWYMNYYQDSNQPRIDSDDVYVFDNLKAFQKKAKKSEYRCPCCGGVSTYPYECNSGKIVKNIKDGKDGPCNWKVYGLFTDLGKGVFIFLKDKCAGERIFKPIEFE